MTAQPCMEWISIEKSHTSHFISFSVYRKLLVTFTQTSKFYYPYFFTVWYYLHPDIYKCLRILSGWTKRYVDLIPPWNIFLNSGYPRNVNNKSFSKFMDKISKVKGAIPKIDKKLFVLVPQCLFPISVQTKSTKWNISLKCILNCCILQEVLKN